MSAKFPRRGEVGHIWPTAYLFCLVFPNICSLEIKMLATDHDLHVFYGNIKYGLLCFYIGKTVRKSLNGRNLQQMTRVTKGICLYKNSDPKWLSAPAPGLYTCIKTWKIMYKIRLQRYFFETCNKWAKWQGRILSIKGFLPLPQGYIHVEKHLKMCIK